VAALLLAPPPPLLPPLLRLRVGEQGIGFPRAARVGEIQRRRRLLIAAGRGGTWTAPMRWEAAGARRDGAMTGARGFAPFDASKRGRREDDDADVGMTQGRTHLAAALARWAVGGRRGGWLGRPTGRQQVWARSEVGGPRCIV
jgi:hypothetical protein